MLQSCAMVIHPGHCYEPTEYCENDAVQGSEYCTVHAAADWDDDSADREFAVDFYEDGDPDDYYDPDDHYDEDDDEDLIAA